MAATGLFRGEGGAVWEFDLPLTPLLQSALDKGLLTLVEPPKAKRQSAVKKATSKAPSMDADES